MARLIVMLLILMCAVTADASWWDGFSAPPTGQGLDGDARVMHVHDGDLFVGGTFSDAGGTPAWFAACWDGDGWRDVGGGTNHRLDALCSYDDDLIVGGRFTEAGGTTVEYVASWDGLAWSPIGMASWTFGYVLSLAVHDGDLYAGGTGYVARWDGVVWQKITGTGFTGDVFALASYDGALFAGGAFPTVVNPGGDVVAATNVAGWDGAEWTAVDGGTNGSVYALTVHDDDLIAGGVFSSPGSLIAGWNGTSWFEPGGGLVGTFVTALDSWSGLLLVGGDFTGGGAIAMSRIGILDGGQWAPMGDGVNGMVRTIASRGAEVFAGGGFLYAGGEPSRYVGRWDDPDVGVETGPPGTASMAMTAPFPNPSNPGVSIALRLDTDALVRVGIYDLTGRRLRNLWNDVLPAGDRTLVWDGLTDDGRSAPSGVYLARAGIAGYETARTLTLVR